MPLVLGSLATLLDPEEEALDEISCFAFACSGSFRKCRNQPLENSAGSGL
jgi:hypothetical protein